MSFVVKIKARLLLVGLQILLTTQLVVAEPTLFEPSDKKLQKRLDKVISDLGLESLVAQKRLGIALVDVSNLNRPKVSSVNGNQMIYAASLPKIAILFGLFKRVEEGSITYEEEVKKMAHQMIRYSSNWAATELYDLVQPQYLSELLQSPQYKLYDPEHGGGLWVGKEYSKAPAWKQDPIRSLSHAATPLQVARFYYLLLTDRLVSPELRPEMEDALADPGLEHKFMLGMKRYCPEAKLLRKSGSWEGFHADSAVISHAGRKYIAVGLVHDSDGAMILEGLIPRLDEAIFGVRAPRKKCYSWFF